MSLLKFSPVALCLLHTTLLLVLYIESTSSAESAETLLSSQEGSSSQLSGSRQKRAPGWGKRGQASIDVFDDNDDELSDDADSVEEGLLGQKRAPGWGKRFSNTFDEAYKRAPGWGKRASQWNGDADKRAPGWGKRAPGWGKRMAGFDGMSVESKRAPGWGKRSSYMEESWVPRWSSKRAPGWGGKRAPGWGGKRAPGWGKRSMAYSSDDCLLLKQMVDEYTSNAVETEAKRIQQCGSAVDSNERNRK